MYVVLCSAMYVSVSLQVLAMYLDERFSSFIKTGGVGLKNKKKEISFLFLFESEVFTCR